MTSNDSELVAVVAFLDGLDADPALVALRNEARGLNKATGRLHRRERGYSTMVVRQKRAELEALREQVQELETQLGDSKRLKTSRRSCGSLAGAENEMYARIKAEATNQELRERLASVDQLRKNVARLVSVYLKEARSSGGACVELKEIGSSVMLGRTSAFFDAPSILEAMIGEVEAVFASVSLHPLGTSASCSLTSVEKQDRGEVRSTTASRCSVGVASSLLGGEPPGDHPPPLVNEATADGNAYRRAMFLSLRNRREPKMQLFLEHFGRRVHDPVTGQVVIVVVALIRIPAISNDVLLKEQFWTRISPNNELGSTGSIAHWCYQIHDSSTAKSTFCFR